LILQLTNMTMTKDFSIKDELTRKLFHLIFGVFFLYLSLKSKDSSIFFTILFIFLISIELVIHKSLHFRKIFYQLFGKLLRNKEMKDNFSLKSFHYFVLAFALSLIFFEKKIALIALSIMVFSDISSAIIGKKFGSIKAVNNKSLQGSVAFFATSILVVYFCQTLFDHQIPFFKIILVSLVATIAEILSGTIDDNLSVPLITGLFVTMI
jgi:dolichol kinase